MRRAARRRGQVHDGRMQTHFADQCPQARVTLLQRGGRFLLLLLPAALLLGCCLRHQAERPALLWLGTLFQVLACALVLWGHQGLRDPISSAVITLYVIALSWLV